MVFYNIAAGICSALGDSRPPFLFLAFSSTANVAVDIWFVSFFQMGVAGVAWATFLCQGTSCILAMGVLIKRISGIQTDGKIPVFSVDLLKKTVRIALPSILQQTFISVGNIIIQGVVNGFGPGVIAGYSAAVKLNNLVITSFTTLGNGISNYTAQNIGAGRMQRVRAGFKAGIKMVWLICIPIVILYFAAGGILMRFFIENPSPTAMVSGVEFLKIVPPFYFVISVKLAADGILRGAGLMKPFMIATFSDLILRVVLASVLSIQFGYIGIWCSWPVGWGIGAALSIYYYHKGPWKAVGNFIKKDISQ